MARIPYTGEGSAFRRLLNHSPAVSDAYWGLRKALDEGAIPAKIRMLSFLVTDITNGCRY
ncbi:MAG: hypothetical protein H0V71_00210 [Chloroflexi bacterium]|nr:hypothetical protein [Chloroflexota bacterium]MDQ3399939.1 hypothetical protein [Chloroflexota bacterium]